MGGRYTQSDSTGGGTGTMQMPVGVYKMACTLALSGEYDWAVRVSCQHVHFWVGVLVIPPIIIIIIIIVLVVVVFVIMAALLSRCGRYIFAVWFLSSIFFSLA